MLLPLLLVAQVTLSLYVVTVIIPFASGELYVWAPLSLPYFA